LDTTGDAIFVGTGNVGTGATYCNFMISGDKEA